jgi:hypothetical protein
MGGVKKRKQLKRLAVRRRAWDSTCEKYRSQEILGLRKPGSRKK